MADEQAVVDPQAQPLKRQLELARIKAMFDYYGLSAFYAEAERLIVQEAITDDTTLYSALQNAPGWKERFAGNEQLKANNMKPLTPAEYLTAEDAIKTAVKRAGLPAGFYDTPDQIAKLIGNGVSPDEANRRIQMAKSKVDSVDPYQRAIMQQYYGVSSEGIAAYFLDAERGESLLEQQARAVNIGAGAAAFGFNVSAQQAMAAAERGADDSSTNNLLRQAQGSADRAKQLGAIYGETVSESDLVDEALGINNAGAVTSKKKKLASQERAAFSGSSGIGQGSLAQKKQAI